MMPSSGAIASFVVLAACVVPLIIYFVNENKGAGGGSAGGAGAGELCGGVQCGVKDMAGKPWCLNEKCVGCRSNSDCAKPAQK